MYAMDLRGDRDSVKFYIEMRAEEETGRAESLTCISARGRLDGSQTSLPISLRLLQGFLFCAQPWY